MTGTLARFLYLHGSIVLMAGLLCGFPYWILTVQGRTGNPLRSWRVAHTTLIPAGMMMLVVGLLLPAVSLPGELITVLAWSLVISGYSFIWALAGGAWAGYRGLTPGPFGVNTLFFIGHLLGAAGSLAGVGLLIAGALLS